MQQILVQQMKEDIKTQQSTLNSCINANYFQTITGEKTVQLNLTSHFACYRALNQPKKKIQKTFSMPEFDRIQSAY